MAKIKGEVGFTVGGKAYTLLFNIDALCALEERTGQSIVQITGTMMDPAKQRLPLVLDMFWAGLQPRHSGTTPEDAKALADEFGIFDAMALVASAFSAAFPEQKGQPVPLEIKPVAKAGRTGSKS